MELTLLAAIKRVNDLTGFYAAEKNRQEDNLVKALLPASLSLAALFSKQIDGAFISPIKFLIVFFFTYAALIYHDLYAAERVFAKAHALQSRLYVYAIAKGGTSLVNAVTADDYTEFQSMETEVGRIRYVMPTGKPLLAALFGLLFLIVDSFE